MEMPKTGDVLFLELQKTASYQIGPQIRIPRPQFTLRPEKIDFIALNALKKGKVLFLELLM